MKGSAKPSFGTWWGLAALVATLWLTAGGQFALAQFGRGGGPPLEPEKAQAAWALQAKAVAAGLTLEEKAATALAGAYKSARESYQKAMQEVIGSGGGPGGGGGPGNFQALQEIRQTESGKLDNALKLFLNDEQRTQALASLGTFSVEWDRHVDTLAGFGLEAAKLDEALKHTVAYVVEVDKAMQEAMASFDFQAVRGARQTAKEKLDKALASILSEDQVAKWNEATAPRGGGGGFGGGRGPGGGGGGRGPGGGGPRQP